MIHGGLGPECGSTLTSTLADQSQHEVVVLEGKWVRGVPGVQRRGGSRNGDTWMSDELAPGLGPAPAPADPRRLALDGSLMVCPDCRLATAASNLEAERSRLVAERRSVDAAKVA